MVTTIRTSLLIVLIIQALMMVGSSAATDYSKEKEQSYWLKVADTELKKSIRVTNTLGRAKNVILFIGDGMGPTTVTAGRILGGQMEGLNGEEHRLSFDRFPHTGLSVTYSVDTQITDSAASATAYLSGVKTNQKMLGLNAKAHYGNCSSSKGNEVTSILRWSLDAGKSGGVVSTTTVTHATPGATYSHTPHRDWEVDRKLTDEAKKDGCKDIARQLVEDNPDINVILGGGMSYFKPSVNYSYPRPDTSEWYKDNKRGRLDNKDLTKMWQKMKQAKGQSHKFVTDKTELNNVDPKNTDYLFGLFTEFHMAYEMERNQTVEPSLAEMTEKAIQVLRKNPNGYFLLVEGGRIDHGHHASKASLALHDVVAFSNAVSKAAKMTSEEDTLILVTADHSHTMSISGYSTRGADILGKSTTESKAIDHKPYTTLIYANGMGHTSPRENLTNVNITGDKDYVYQSAVPMYSETHGGEDVAMYARGPQSHLYSGVHENNYIPILMAYASCVGPYSSDNDCARALNVNGVPRSSDVSLMTMIGFTLLAVTIRRFGC